MRTMRQPKKQKEQIPKKTNKDFRLNELRNEE